MLSITVIEGRGGYLYPTRYCKRFRPENVGPRGPRLRLAIVSNSWLVPGEFLKDIKVILIYLFPV
jgi:hypothetical protein